jgi:hypothetical protein
MDIEGGTRDGDPEVSPGPEARRRGAETLSRDLTFNRIASSQSLAGDGFQSLLKRGVAMMCMQLAQHRV